jgi:hypothetical protein
LPSRGEEAWSKQTISRSEIKTPFGVLIRVCRSAHPILERFPDSKHPLSEPGKSDLAKDSRKEIVSGSSGKDNDDSTVAEKFTLFERSIPRLTCSTVRTGFQQELW